MSRQLFATKTEWEPLVGYSRAVRVNDHVFVSGTVATDANGAVVAPGDAYAQAIQVLENLKSALERAGSSLGRRRPHADVRHRYLKVEGVRSRTRRVFS